MTHRILFVATLHHPEQLLKEQANATNAKPLFPSSMAQSFWAKAMQKQGYVVEVFWRNLPFYTEDIRSLKSFKSTNGITLDKLITAFIRRLPYRLNIDYRQRNARLIAHALRFKPTVLWLIGDNTVIAPETLAFIKQETGCRVFYVSGTSPIVFSLPLERKSARLYDWVLVNDFYHGIQWQELGAKQMRCLPIVAIDPDFHAPRTLTDAQRARYKCEVSFVGTLVPHALYSERVQALEALRDVDLGIWSIHDAPPSLKAHIRGSALGDEMMNIISASPITLNTHGDFMRWGGNMRLFESAGVGAFQLCDDRVGIRDWFTVGEHLDVFTDLQDLREKVAFYLANPAIRQRMIDSARAHALAHHTYDHRLATLIQEGIL